jgi:hypothetical protein
MKIVSNLCPEFPTSLLDRQQFYFGPVVDQIIYRRYNALYFIVLADETESCLAMLDFIQYFVEAMDKCIPDVCELDIMINNVLVHAILDEMVVAGFLLPTSASEILEIQIFIIFFRHLSTLVLWV